MKTYEIVELRRRKGTGPEWGIVWAEDGGPSWPVDGVPLFGTKEEAIDALQRLKVRSSKKPVENE